MSERNKKLLEMLEKIHEEEKQLEKEREDKMLNEFEAIFRDDINTAVKIEELLVKNGITMGDFMIAVPIIVADVNIARNIEDMEYIKIFIRLTRIARKYLEKKVYAKR